MADKEIIKKELILRVPHAKTSEEILTMTADCLRQQGYVKDSFKAALLDREKNFPTGIRVGNINVAIPHTDAVHVLKTTIAVALLEEPVAFREIGTNDGTVDVSIVLNMAIQDGNKQVDFLRKISELIQNQDCLKEILTADNTEKIAAILNQKLS